jgi:hypothetical protein
MAQQTTVLAPSARVARRQPPAAAESAEPECRTVWRDSVAHKQDLQAARPDVIWPHRERITPWAAYVLMRTAVLDVSGSAEPDRLPGRLAIAIAYRDATRQRLRRRDRGRR